MTDREIMLTKLKKNTIPKLRELGFVGSYPHFRRVCAEHIELILFQTNKWGGSFTVEVSAVFPNGEFKNCVLFDDISFDDIKCDSTNERYRLPCMFDGWFYYSDLYLKRTLFFGKIYCTERDFAGADRGLGGGVTIPKGYKLVWKFDEDSADAICEKLNDQLNDAFVWLKKFIRKHI